MTDRELLELAAKAAGIHALHDPQGILRDCTGFHQSMNIFAGKPWNPLTDDADALRLAVKLRMDVTFNETDVFAFPYDGQDGASEVINTDDDYAATRRAIVRAAAEIGKAM